MTNTEYGIIGTEKSFKERRLIAVPHRNKLLIAGCFGPNKYGRNLELMSSGEFPCLPEYSQIRFRPATTSESISIAAYDFGEICKPQIFDYIKLQAGRIVRTQEGVFANPPKDEQGNPVTNEDKLKSLLNNAEKVNGIYLSDNDFGFAPYETFEHGTQKSEVFAQGGLARLLEHTYEKSAENLKKISSKEFYPKGVRVLFFNPAIDPVNVLLSKTVDLYSGRSIRYSLGYTGGHGGYLIVRPGFLAGGRLIGGYAFGVLDESSESPLRH